MHALPRARGASHVPPGLPCSPTASHYLAVSPPTPRFPLLQSKEADELFACLKEASAVLIVPAEHVGQLGDENRMSRVSQKLQHTFAKLRQDYKAADLSRFFADFK